MVRRCLDCHRLFNVAGRFRSRCPWCESKVKARKNADAPMARAVVARATVCAICGLAPTPTDPLTADHIQPVSKGGLTVPANLRPAHVSCNTRKKAKW